MTVDGTSEGSTIGSLGDEVGTKDGEDTGVSLGVAEGSTAVADTLGTSTLTEADGTSITIVLDEVAEKTGERGSVEVDCGFPIVSDRSVLMM